MRYYTGRTCAVYISVDNDENLALLWVMLSNQESAEQPYIKPKYIWSPRATIWEKKTWVLLLDLIMDSVDVLYTKDSAEETIGLFHYPIGE